MGFLVLIQERDQRLCVAAYRLLQKALLQEYGINELPQFTYNEVGKPLLEGLPHVHFSLSHCSEAAACCVSDQPVGIDIEVLTHYSEQVALRVMNDDEMCLIKASADPATAFTRLWTMKESLYKLTGDDADGNIAHLLDNTTDYRFTTLIYPQYILTHCTKH